MFYFRKRGIVIPTNYRNNKFTILGKVILVIYNFVWFLALPFLIVFCLVKSIHSPNQTDRYKKKFCIGNQHLFKELYDKPLIIIHSVSGGESSVAAQLAKKIMESGLKKCGNPYSILITTHTKSGYDMANKKLTEYKEFAKVCYIPYDFYPLINKFIKNTNPNLFVIIEAEIWPSLIVSCHYGNTPIVNANARVYEKDYKTYKTYKFLFEHYLKLYHAFYAQSDLDKDRLISIGAEKDKVEFIGNMKFDMSLDIQNSEDIKYKFTNHSNNIYVMAASTHKGEEEIFMEALLKIKKTQKNIKMLMAPRDINRVEELQNLIFSKNLSYDLFSQKVPYEKDVIIVDTFGDLMKIYPLSHIVVMGGSFSETIGGHNFLEAAVYGIPVWVGPYTHNFKDITDIFSTQSVITKVNEKNSENLYESLKDYFVNKEIYIKKGEQGKNLINSNQGSTKLIMQKCINILTTK